MYKSIVNNVDSWNIARAKRSSFPQQTGNLDIIKINTKRHSSLILSYQKFYNFVVTTLQYLLNFFPTQAFTKQSCWGCRCCHIYNQQKYRRCVFVKKWVCFSQFRILLCFWLYFFLPSLKSYFYCCYKHSFIFVVRPMEFNGAAKFTVLRQNTPIFL